MDCFPPRHPAISFSFSSQSYIFKRNFYLFFFPSPFCDFVVSVLLLLRKRALGFTFYSDTDGRGYRVPGVALSSCVQQLFSAKAAQFFCGGFFYGI